MKLSAPSTTGRTSARNVDGRREPRVPSAVWHVSALWAAMLLAASLVWPMTYGYDELAHFDMAYVYSSDPFHFFAPGELKQTRAAVYIQSWQAGYPPRQSLADWPIAPRGERPSLQDIGGNLQDPNSSPNQMVQHPPLYYWLGALVLKIPGVSSLAYDQQIWLLRLMSVVMMLPIPMLCWSASRHLMSYLDARTRSKALVWGVPAGALLAAAVPLTWSSLVRAGSAVNNDALLILSTSVALERLVAVCRGDLSVRTAAVVTAALTSALWTKGFALSLLLPLAIAYLIGLRQARLAADLRPQLRQLTAVAALLATGVVIGLSWWIHNYSTFGAFQVNGAGDDYQNSIYGPPDFKGQLWDFIPSYLSITASRIWGGIGLPDSPSLGPLFVYGWLTLALVGIGVALIALRGSARGPAFMLGLCLAMVLGITAFGAFSIYQTWSNQVVATSGRYVMTCVLSVAVLSALGWQLVMHTDALRKSTAVVVALGLLTNAVTWLFILRYWYGPTKDAPQLDQIQASLSSFFRWSPVPSWTSFLLVAIIPAVTSSVLMARLCRQLRSGAD